MRNKQAIVRLDPTNGTQTRNIQVINRYPEKVFSLYLENEKR